MAENSDQVYKTQADITAELLAALLARIPDANTGPDSIWRIWIEVFSNTAEGLLLGQQLLHDDMFIQTMNALALMREGEMFGRPQKAGTIATGTVRFDGAGGTYIPVGTVVSSPRPSTDDVLDFVTTADATIPNPGLPDAPVATDIGTAGALTGTFEYAVTFLTAEGETEIGDVSNALVLAASHTHLSAIPLGGPGTTGRRIYRRVNGGMWGNLHDLADNVTTVWDDNAAATGAGTPPVTSTAERITVAAQASDVGVDYNVAVGTITDLSDAPSGLSDVTNLVAFTGGGDPEDIETYRTELLKWVRAPMSGSPDDLVAWAESIDGIESATAFPNVNLAGAAAPGTVSVRVSGPGGTIPDAAHVASVLAELQSHDLANITILVDTFAPHNIDVDMTLTLADGYVLADVTPTVTEAITDYINSVPVGGTVYRAGLYHAVYGLAGVKTLTIATPAADVAVAATEKPVPHTITLH